MLSLSSVPLDWSQEGRADSPLERGGLRMPTLSSTEIFLEMLLRDVLEAVSRLDLRS